MRKAFAFAVIQWMLKMEPDLEALIVSLYQRRCKHLNTMDKSYYMQCLNCGADRAYGPHWDAGWNVPDAVRGTKYDA